MMRIAWWIYFWLLVVGLSSALSERPVDSVQAGFSFAIAASLVGLWGYLRRRPIGHRYVWVAVLVLLAISVVVNASRPFVTDSPYRAWGLYGAAINTVLCIPLLWAIWRYSLGSSNIWRSASAV
jgi:hypothetical protein